ncbi:MAG TPA: hypothetical protein VII47_04000 [Actinomycetota bacterium]
MSNLDILSLYLDTRGQAARWEGLQTYRVPWEDDQIAAWRRGDPLPPNTDIEASLETIRQITESGRRIVRVRGIRQPMSEYTQYEIEAAYPPNVAAGEEIHVVDLDEHSEFEAVGDFVIFDDDGVVQYLYDSEGHLLGYNLTDQPGDLTEYRAIRERLLAAAVPLGEFSAKAR